MRRAGAIVLLAVAGLGLLGLLVVAGRDKRDLAFTLGVVPTIPAATLKPGVRVCQVPIGVPDEFNRVRLRAGSPGGPGQPLQLTVVDVATNSVVGRGRLPGGYPYSTEQSASVGQVGAERRIAVCVRNLGGRNVQIFGNTDAGSPTSHAFIRGRGLPNDLTLVFLRSGERSQLAALPDLFERASVFRPGWVGPWVYWLLAAGVLLGVPLLLARALALSEEPPEAPEPPAHAS
jgi:hypothetical protein